MSSTAVALINIFKSSSLLLSTPTKSSSCVEKEGQAVRGDHSIQVEMASEYSFIWKDTLTLPLITHRDIPPILGCVCIVVEKSHQGLIHIIVHTRHEHLLPAYVIHSEHD